ncbi:Na+/H+ antiporter NhaA [Polymorphobacter arshaanensis]|uniref:Na(+)/H(+) antiporter NhaA n=1 Tax=Glacieibacterium arshaanense TaxID=2511025 RepID=A0A4Y9ESD4_9SPHN|nr:Na+/H+ antiporter NhaA [Polymorphobacter arshaanensis]TFU06546.1 Na+/H+ antiporter NhaA [Polymorphobacter arshaanensis]
MNHTAPRWRPASTLRQFLATEAAGGYILMAAAAAALIVANSPLSGFYAHTLHIEFAGHSLLHWINDGLMAVFFLLIGLEVKRELVDGELSTNSRRILPGAAAFAGMAVPALIYLAFNYQDPAHRDGWAIPAATDIAFALGVLALLGSRVPGSLKILLTAIAIIDDLGAIIIIAVAYTAKLDFLDLGLAGAGLLMLVGLNRFKVTALAPYLIIGIFIWYETLLSGVHATLAGVAVALTIPLRTAANEAVGDHSPLHKLEHALAPIVAFIIVPIFGFANAGVSLLDIAPGTALGGVPVGVALGLFLGKQLGVFGAIWAMVKLGFADMPVDASWRQIYGVAILCGIGFTMSLFIAALAFGEGSAENEIAKIGILAGSFISALVGWFVLNGSRRSA